jgi:hypothetical protein
VSRPTSRSGKVHTTMRKLGEEGPSGIIHYGYKFIPDKQV